MCNHTSLYFMLTHLISIPNKIYERRLIRCVSMKYKLVWFSSVCAKLKRIFYNPNNDVSFTERLYNVHQFGDSYICTSSMFKIWQSLINEPLNRAVIRIIGFNPIRQRRKTLYWKFEFTSLLGYSTNQTKTSHLKSVAKLSMKLHNADMKKAFNDKILVKKPHVWKLKKIK
jgi:hypothetical protein